MSLKHLLDHKCDIYHPERQEEGPGYGLPGQINLRYRQEPDETDILCHFSIIDSTLKLVQQQPLQFLEGRIKLTLPLNADIRLYDKVVSKENGMKYIAELPRKIRNHHISVYLKPEYGVKGAI